MALEVGQILEGTVTGLVKFGAFVELEDKTIGLVHISEVASEYVSDVNDYLKIHDKVKVKVLSIDGKGKVALSMKQAESKKNSFHGKFDKEQHHEEHGRHDIHHDAFHKAKDTYEVRGHNGFRDDRKVLPVSFEDKLNRFLRDSDERQLDLKRNVESKRGGRGAKRNS